MTLSYLMKNPEIISPSTNNALRQATLKYFARIAMPQYIKGLDGFAGAYLQRTPPEDLYVLVTASTPESLVINFDNEGDIKEFVDVDLDVPQEGVASIVAPGWYDEEGRVDIDNGRMERRVVRPLTEKEAQELTMDLYSIMNGISQAQ